MQFNFEAQVAKRSSGKNLDKTSKRIAEAVNYAMYVPRITEKRKTSVFQSVKSGSTRIVWRVWSSREKNNKVFRNEI